MKIEWMRQIRICVITAITFAAAFAFAHSARADSAFVAGTAVGEKVVIVHQGPGVGSTKTPPFNNPEVFIAERAEVVTLPGSNTYFHVREYQPELYYHMGPGLGSTKSPPFNNPFPVYPYD